jgi:hypothetical protein
MAIALLRRLQTHAYLSLQPAFVLSVVAANGPGSHLVVSATAADEVVVFRVGVGDVLYEDSALADIHGSELTDPVVRVAVVRGLERSFDQDPMSPSACWPTSRCEPCPPVSTTPRQRWKRSTPWTAAEDLLPAASAAMVLERLRRLLVNLLETAPAPAHPALLRPSEEVRARHTGGRQGAAPLRRSPVADDARDGVRPAP